MPLNLAEDSNFDFFLVKMKDRQGINRKECIVLGCVCQEYCVRLGNSIKCEFCDHSPTNHLEDEDGVQTDEDCVQTDEDYALCVQSISSHSDHQYSENLTKFMILHCHQVDTILKEVVSMSKRQDDFIRKSFQRQDDLIAGMVERYENCTRDTIERQERYMKDTAERQERCMKETAERQERYMKETAERQDSSIAELKDYFEKLSTKDGSFFGYTSKSGKPYGITWGKYII